MKKYIIGFLQPKHLPSPIAGVEILYSYKITTIEDTKEIMDETIKGVKVSISSSLVNTFEYQIWEESNYYNDLIKILFVLVKKAMEQNVRMNGAMIDNEILQDNEIMNLLPRNYTSGRPFNPDELQEPTGQILEIEVPVKVTF